MANAAKLFYSRDGDAETLNQRIRPSDDQRAYLLEHKNELAEWLTDDTAELGMEVRTFIQGSYRFRTLIKPLVEGDEYDVDLGLYFAGKPYADVDPLELREKVQRSLTRYGAASDQVKQIEEPRERCCRATYKKNFHIDVPVYLETPAGRVVRLATLTNGWEKSDPEAMLQWFDAAIGGDSSDRAMIRRLIRYMKAWAALTFRPPAVPPSSLMLTVLVADAFEKLSLGGHSDDDAFAKAARAIYERLLLDRQVSNPVGGDSDADINRLSAPNYRIFLEQLATLVEVAERAIECESAAEAAVTWAEVFSYAFPLPDDLDVLAESSNGMQVASPSFVVTIYEADRKTLVSAHEGYVPHARVGQWINFQISNPEVIPAGAQIRWVVRNAGSEAMAISDLGHAGVDEGEFNQWERAAYRGRHYMDCEVWMHGRLRSLSRIPVTIDRISIPSRTPPRRPAYTKLMRRRKS